MSRHSLAVIALLFVAFLTLGSEVQASGFVTFEVKVLDGLKISTPGFLTFEAVAPGEIDDQELPITVWSNVRWTLSVRAVNPDGLQGAIEMSAGGIWHELSATSCGVASGQPTGSEGVTVHIPFRLQGGYDHLPGDYTFSVEFTVGPSI